MAAARPFLFPHRHLTGIAGLSREDILSLLDMADDAVPQPHTERIYNAAASKDKTFKVIKGATHYYAGQPELLQEAVDLCLAWMRERKLLA